MKAYSIVQETIEAALEIVLIFLNINNAVNSGELTAAEAEQIKQNMMEA